jgi:hypothetical protein
MRHPPEGGAVTVKGRQAANPKQVKRKGQFGYCGYFLPLRTAWCGSKADGDDHLSQVCATIVPTGHAPDVP